MSHKIIKQFQSNKTKALECIYKMVKHSKKDKKDVVGMPCIQESNGKLVMTPNEKLKVWKEYEEKLLNEENDWNKELKKEIVEGPCEKISSEDVLEAVKLMKFGENHQDQVESQLTY